ncbi:TPA: hypothetical protein DHW58_00425 [Patescibacteria group bacterium]|uniref:Type IV secretory pathway VirB4 component-like protein n=2 Tax=Bacteria division Kazan-3B-28 TaxID=1798534 RepID=A0A0G2A4R1_UNCK3|nr:MAG: hypothetical protein VE98_C0001G0558 [candidate division Kazan bacterium GW2011_GWA1_50_15]KKW25756.1 MAG: hypothetical protein VE99_C0001G0395 [candidate division Kazan bacterium GW2011_GWC1_52_13]KKW27229.1 MAG: hypothetical protein VF00_C0001G0164 [candidate division Kazan bacterium GW2011_GWB1_52_7]HAV65955.1 hypothetical protein [Patescibacteria group bacterium]HCL47443.1 hypothetical protein [Patescibacteria group bacterium]
MAKKSNSTQKFLPIKEVRDGIVVLKTGGFRTVLMANAINFNLKSRDEQEALLGQYQEFLNGLGFPIQIVVQSRTLDLDKYLAQLDTLAREQTNELLRTQTAEYTGFVRELIGVANIMSKTFYIVIPYDTGFEAPSGGFLGKLFGKKSGPITTGGRFAEIKTKLLERTSLVSSGLAGLGLHNVQLNTQELIELFYSTYNPDTARRQKLFSVSNVDASVIQNIKEAQQGQ